jgi:hypothetical protein
MRHSLKLEEKHFSPNFTPEFPDGFPDGTSFPLDDYTAGRYMDSKEKLRQAQIAFKDMVDLTNSMSNNNVLAIGVARQLAQTHRTLQQSTIGQVLYGISIYLEWAKENDRFDARNEAVVKMSDDLKTLLDKHPLPFI